MSKKNYNKISTEAAKANVEAETVTEEVVETVSEPVVEPIIEEEPKVEVIYGIVDNCSRLNVRSKPNIKSEVVCVIPAGFKVVVDKVDVKGNFYKVSSVNNGNASEGFNGFCIKNYITIKK